MCRAKARPIFRNLKSPFRDLKQEEVGFEPTERVNVRQFSRLLQSTALALLHSIAGYSHILQYQYPLSIMSFPDCIQKYFRILQNIIKMDDLIFTIHCYYNSILLRD